MTSRRLLYYLLLYVLTFQISFYRISASTWQKLEMVSGGSLTKMIKLLAALHGQRLATEEHFQAVERRLLKVYATVQYCIGKYGRGKVIKNWLI